MNWIKRFWAKVDKNGPVPAHRPDLGPCWLWTAFCHPDGYGRFWFKGRMRQAHVVSYEIGVGPIPPGKEPDHLCRVRNCVNHGHLEPVTHAQNVKRGTQGRWQLAKTHCPQGHRYVGENLYVRPDGKRLCRTCQREAKRLLRMNLRAA